MWLLQNLLKCGQQQLRDMSTWTLHPLQWSAISRIWIQPTTKATGAHCWDNWDVFCCFGVDCVTVMETHPIVMFCAKFLSHHATLTTASLSAGCPNGQHAPSGKIWKILRHHWSHQINRNMLLQHLPPQTRNSKSGAWKAKKGGEHLPCDCECHSHLHIRF